jgi:hypothetical protein
MKDPATAGFFVGKPANLPSRQVKAREYGFPTKTEQPKGVRLSLFATPLPGFTRPKAE